MKFGIIQYNSLPLSFQKDIINNNERGLQRGLSIANNDVGKHFLIYFVICLT